jgi:putative signal transducing protein
MAGKEQVMAKFYDTCDADDLARVEAVLRGGGIEYALRPAGQTGAFVEIHVAEEDVFHAAELLEAASSS